MDPLNPMASTLDPAISQIYSQASSIRDTLRAAIPAPSPPSPSQTKSPSSPSATTTRNTTTNRLRTKQLALSALEAPARVRALVAAGRRDDAAAAWDLPRRLLVAWRDRGLGGAEDVSACIADGDAALRDDGGEVGGGGEGKAEGEKEGGGGDATDADAEKPRGRRKANDGGGGNED